MSYTFLKYHVVFATKERRTWLASDFRPRLCQFLGGMIRQQGGVPVQIPGPFGAKRCALILFATYGSESWIRKHLFFSVFFVTFVVQILVF